MWCEVGQRDCEYLEIVKHAQEDAALRRATESTVAGDEIIEHNAQEIFAAQGEFACGENFCQALGFVMWSALSTQKLFFLST